MNTTNASNWAELVRLQMEDGGIVLKLGPALLLIGVIGILVWFICRKVFFKTTFASYEVVEAELSIAHFGKIKIKPNDESARIAYQAWVELSTRKVGLAFDEANDVVDEVYVSWYETFGRLRDLARSISASQLRSSADTRRLVELMVRVLNEGLRPHLTLWQARFKRWYHTELNRPENVGLTPQDIQKKFPQYSELIQNLRHVQSQIVEYRGFLWKIAAGDTQTPTQTNEPELREHSRGHS